MQNRPTAAELLEAVRELLTAEIMPTIHDDGLRFKTLIAANVLAIVGRELTAEDEPVNDEISRLSGLLPRAYIAPEDPVRDTILALNYQLAKAIREAPDGSSLLMVGGKAWEHVKESLRDQLAVASPKFDTNYSGE